MFGCCCNQGPARPETPERRIVRAIMPWNPIGPGVVWNTNLDQLAIFRPFQTVSQTGQDACDLLKNNGFQFEPGILSELLTGNEDGAGFAGILEPESNVSHRYFHALVNVSWQNIVVTDGVAAAVTYATEFEVDSDYRDGLLNNLRYELSTYTPGPWYEFSRDAEGTETTTDHTTEHPYDLGNPYHPDLSELGALSTLVSATVEAADDDFAFQVVVDVDCFGDASQIVRLTYFGTIILTGKRTYDQQNTSAQDMADDQPFADLDANTGLEVRYVRAGGGFTYDADVITEAWAVFPYTFDAGITSGAYSALLVYSPSLGWVFCAYSAYLVWAQEQYLLPETWGGMVDPLPEWYFEISYETNLYTSHAGSVDSIACSDGRVTHPTVNHGGNLSGTATTLTIQDCPVPPP